MNYDEIGKLIYTVISQSIADVSIELLQEQIIQKNILK